MSPLALVLAVVVVNTELVSSLRLNTGPRNTKARMGDSVTLECDIDGLDNEYIIWYQEPSKTYLTFNRYVREEVDDNRKQRYSITGSTFWNEFNLNIKNLQPLDNGYFYCGYVDGDTYTVLGSAHLTVISPPDSSSPSCSFSLLDGSGSSTPVAGSTVDLMCSWSGGHPAPTASWYRDGVNMSQNTEESYVWTRRELTSEDNGMAFSCHMESEALQEAPRSCTVMPLRIPPVVTVAPSLATAKIGGSVVFTCGGSSLRRITSYRWNIPSESLPRLRNRYQVSNNQRSIRLIDIEAEDDNLVITCSVRTGRGLIGTGEATLRVQPPTTTPAPTTTEEPTEPPTTSLPLTTSSNQETHPTNKTTVIIDSGYITQYNTMSPTDASPVAALPQTAVIGIGIAAALIVLIVILVLIVYVMRYRTKSSTIRRDTSMHLVNRTYDTVLKGGRIVDNPELRNQPEYRSSFRVNSRPVAFVNPVLQTTRPKNQNNPSVTYAKVNKKKHLSHAEARAQRPASPLYDVVPDDETPEVDQVVVNLGSDNPAGLTREPTYMNQNEVRTDPDPRMFNAEGLTYAELELQNEGRLPSKKDLTLYAKLK